ncbi:MAG: hypothetical protein ACAH80_04955 [Alphaproteobacteria bacterium]
MATKPSEGQNVEVGAPLASVVGGAGSQVEVVGRQGGALLNSTMADLAVMNMIASMAQTMGAINPARMEPGATTLRDAVGTNADAYARSGSEFGSTMLDNMLKFGVVATLFSMGSMNSGPSDEMKRQMQAEDERNKAAIALSQAEQAEGIAKQDRDRVAALTAPKM